MRRGAPEHPKTYELAARLNVPRYAAVGLLECLFHFAQKYAQQGDIGRWSDTQIAQACAWSGDANRSVRMDSAAEAAEFVAALVATKWLDPDPVHRLLIHDWPEHADGAVKKALKDKGLSFYAASKPRRNRVATKSRLSSDSVATELTLTPQITGKGREGKAREGLSVSGGESERGDPWSDFERWWRDYPRKEAKQTAFKVWERIDPDPETQTRMLEALVWQKRSADWLKKDGEFIPHGATYLNNRRWEDEPRESAIPESANPELAETYLAAKRFAERKA